MKQQIKKEKNNILKKLFIKLCRLLGYEIIDQSNFRITTQERSLNENLSIQGKKSITLPLGETKITRNVKELTVINTNVSATLASNAIIDVDSNQKPF